MHPSPQPKTPSTSEPPPTRYVSCLGVQDEPSNSLPGNLLAALGAFPNPEAHLITGLCSASLATTGQFRVAERTMHIDKGPKYMPRCYWIQGDLRLTLQGRVLRELEASTGDVEVGEVEQGRLGPAWFGVV
ncbi:hypothetical protein DFP72DRAFT_847702 [Ephemerocybe angulata]|uniref:Uncharacterized protein n=1 Tax=Ephemerocybe angulata TaxID=980116 RepID=A0A8H6I0I3_9AGAR|nr:hypothetical protein DFP72DRAFT_847702 [Tulosesus angulatus]